MLGADSDDEENVGPGAILNGVTLDELAGLKKRIRSLKPISREPQLLQASCDSITQAVETKLERRKTGREAFIRAGKKAMSMQRTVLALAQSGRWLERADESESLYGKRELVISDEEDEGGWQVKARQQQRRTEMIAELQSHLESGMLDEPMKSQVKVHLKKLDEISQISAMSPQVFPDNLSGSSRANRKSTENVDLLSAEERKTALQMLFHDIDESENGFIDPAEIADLLTANNVAGIATRDVRMVINRMDTVQKDGVLEFEELERAMQRHPPTLAGFLSKIQELHEEVQTEIEAYRRQEEANKKQEADQGKVPSDFLLSKIAHRTTY